jgi:hypothetical protein
MPLYVNFYDDAHVSNKNVLGKHISGFSVSDVALTTTPATATIPSNASVVVVYSSAEEAQFAIGGATEDGATAARLQPCGAGKERFCEIPSFARGGKIAYRAVS